jgi:hypothetical protein
VISRTRLWLWGTIMILSLLCGIKVLFCVWHLSTQTRGVHQGHPLGVRVPNGLLVEGIGCALPCQVKALRANLTTCAEPYPQSRHSPETTTYLTVNESATSHVDERTLRFESTLKCRHVKILRFYALLRAKCCCCSCCLANGHDRRHGTE